MKSIRIYIIALLSSVAGFSLPAQNVHDKITWSPALDIPNSFNDIGMVGNAKEGFVRVFEQNNTNLRGGIIIFNGNHGVSEIILKAVNSQMKVTATFKMDKLTLSQSISTIGFAEMRSNIYWIYSTLEEDKRKIYAYKINLKSAKFEGQPILLVELDKTFSYSHTISSDSTTMLIQYKIRGSKKEENKIGIYVFNEKMMKTSGDEYTLPYKSEELVLTQNLIDRHSNVYFLSRLYDLKNKSSKPLVIRFRKSETTATVIPLDLGGLQPESLVLSEDFDGYVNLLGYYYQKEKAIVGGLFLLQLNAEGTAFAKISKGFYEMPESLLLDYETSHSIGKSEKGVQVNSRDKLRSSSLVVTEFITHPDGSHTIIGEARKEEEMAGSHSVENLHCYNDLITIRLNPAGAMLWVKRLPKNQKNVTVSALDGISVGCSYKAIFQGGNVYILYLDSPKNEKWDPKETPSILTFGDNASFYCLKYDAAGLETKTILLEDVPFKSRINLLDTRIAEPNQLIGFGGYPKESRMCKIKIY
jgi:hypothetical protein